MCEEEYMANTKQYTNESIKALKGADRVRLRPFLRLFLTPSMKLEKVMGIES